MIKDPDEALVERCRKGDGAAFAVLVKRYQGPIYNAAYRVLGNAEDASDITQSVFLKIAERLDDYDPRYKFFSWIYRIALNESLNLLRRNGREEPLGDDEEFLPGDARADPERQALEAELSARVQGALMKLKAQDRMMLALRHFSECSYREIADVLEIDEKTVKSRLFEARSRMRGLLHEVHAA
ncbi:MAG: sigma-70 family RNA polymerase sigma factor [Pseudomonadota bacterium]|nr:sigma-70 family RNA polymerase sigma factor [Pseudomonadota bacterium]